MTTLVRAGAAGAAAPHPPTWTASLRSPLPHSPRLPSHLDGDAVPDHDARDGADGREQRAAAHVPRAPQLRVLHDRPAPLAPRRVEERVEDGEGARRRRRRRRRSVLSKRLAARRARDAAARLEPDGLGDELVERAELRGGREEVEVLGGRADVCEAAALDDGGVEGDAGELAPQDGARGGEAVRRGLGRGGRHEGRGRLGWRGGTAAGMA